LERAHLDTCRGPTHHVPRHAQHARGITERVAGLQTVRFRHPHVLEGDLAVLDHFERNLVLNLLNAEAGRGLVLDDEAFDLVVGNVTCPDDRQVAPGGIADPPLLTVEDPAVALALGGRRQAAARSGANQRLRQAETADFLEAGHWRQPLLFLLFRPVEGDRAHGQPAVHAKEGTDRRVDARQIHRDEAKQLLTSTRTSITLEAKATDPELL